MSRRTRENPECSAAMLTILLAAIKRSRRMRTNTESFIRAVELGWFADYQINDLSYDLGLEDFTDELLADAGVTMATYHYRPRRIDRSAGAFQGLRAADMAQFLIHLERIGLNVDPAPLVDRLLPQIKQLRAISWSELSVLWFAREHHKMVPIALSAPEFALERAGRLEEFKTLAGYKVTAHLVGDEVGFLEIRAPRYRRRAEPEPMLCAVCNYEWMKGDPESSLLHRREHKKRLTVLQPSPDPRFLEALANDAEPELVTATSPKWRQQAMYARALTFQREFGRDFVQWDYNHDDDPKVHGFLFNDDTGIFGHGAIVGACAFRWREYTDHPPCWAMQWVWIAPKARRRGILSRRWDAFRGRFGKFVIEPPLSEAMQAFLARRAARDCREEQRMTEEEADGGEGHG